jgi:hypothetical protein
MTAQELKEGTTVIFRDANDEMYAEAFYSETLGKFIFELNGKFMASETTFSKMLRKVESLKVKHQLYQE